MIGSTPKWGVDPTTNYRSSIYPKFKPGLEVRINVPKRQEYCAKHHLNFDIVVTQIQQPQLEQPTLTSYISGVGGDESGAFDYGGADYSGGGGDYGGGGDCGGDE